MKISPEEAELFHVDGRTDRQTYRHFRNFMNAQKSNQSVNAVYVKERCVH
jgi:hypothetical protein